MVFLCETKFATLSRFLRNFQEKIPQKSLSPRGRRVGRERVALLIRNHPHPALSQGERE